MKYSIGIQEQTQKKLPKQTFTHTYTHTYIHTHILHTTIFTLYTFWYTVQPQALFYKLCPLFPALTSHLTNAS